MIQNEVGEYRVIALIGYASSIIPIYISFEKFLPQSRPAATAKQNEFVFLFCCPLSLSLPSSCEFSIACRAQNCGNVS